MIATEYTWAARDYQMEMRDAEQSLANGRFEWAGACARSAISSAMKMDRYVDDKGEIKAAQEIARKIKAAKF